MATPELRPIAHRPDDFLWSKELYTPLELANSLAYRLPSLLMVTDGYDGEHETIESEQMYWVQEIACQSRIVVKDDKDNYYSIPTNYEYKVTPIKWNGQPDRRQTIREMVDSGATYQYISFASHINHDISRQGESTTSKRFQRLEFVSTYDERFLVGYTVLVSSSEDPLDIPWKKPLKDGIYPIPDVIPVCMPLNFVLGLAFCNEDRDTFYYTLRRFKAYTDQLSRNYDKKLEKVTYIIAYDSKPSDGDYDYIHEQWFTDHAKTVEDSDDSDDYEQIDDDPYIGRFASAAEITWPVAKNMGTACTLEDIYGVLRLSEADFDAAYQPDYGKLTVKPKPIKKPFLPCPSEPVETKKKAPPPPPPADEPVQPRKKVPPEAPPKPSNRKGIPPTYGGKQAAKPKQKETRNDYLAMEDIENNTVKAAGPHSPQPSQYSFTTDKVHEIPKDISKFTVSDVCRCLVLLNLGNFTDKFKEHLIDGEFLRCLDVETLKEEFQLSTMQARLLYRFASEEYRPKL